jgi:prepilin-type N-terminal cleavage/methylation domain-containing protein
MSLLKFILSVKLKIFSTNKNNSGFTLIELLVAMVLAVLIITPLLGFMVEVLNTERREQAKTTTEQEIQASLDFIERDLQQAVYIYDADGLTRNWSNTPPTSSTVPVSGIKDQIPPLKEAPNCKQTNTDGSVCQPILVFWKREFLTNSVGVSSASDTQANQTDDGFAYSLVGYYLITNPTGGNSTWSRAARIGRFQIRGKISAPNATTAKGAISNPGFNPPPLDLTISGATLKDKMNQWKADTASYTSRVETLVDFISTSSSSSPSITCPSGQGVGTNTNGFYACVDASKVLAQVYLRGNAYARLNNNNNDQYTDSASAYFPTANIRVQGRGFVKQ